MLQHLAQSIQHAAANQGKLAIVGRGSKLINLSPTRGQPLPISDYSGIIDYAPPERVISVRAGTLLVELDALLAEQGQMLASEPPTFSGRASLGGALATAWSGPRRPWRGSLRDQLLGITMLNGRGEVLRFGGRVLKNVAGFDVARLMVGSMGRFGVIVEAHLKVEPLPEHELVLAYTIGQADAILRSNQWCCAPLPLSGAAWEDGVLRVRLSGRHTSLQAAREQMGGDIDREGLAWFAALRHRRRPIFTRPPHGMALFRLTLPQATPPLLLSYSQLIEWAGALRWVLAPADATHVIQGAAKLAGGSASRIYPSHQAAPISGPCAALQQRLCAAFDPYAIFNQPRQGG